MELCSFLDEDSEDDIPTRIVSSPLELMAEAGAGARASFSEPLSSDAAREESGPILLADLQRAHAQALERERQLRLVAARLAKEKRQRAAETEARRYKRIFQALVVSVCLLGAIIIFIAFKIHQLGWIS